MAKGKKQNNDFDDAELEKKVQNIQKGNLENITITKRQPKKPIKTKKPQQSKFYKNQSQYSSSESEEVDEDIKPIDSKYKEAIRQSKSSDYKETQNVEKQENQKSLLKKQKKDQLEEKLLNKKIKQLNKQQQQAKENQQKSGNYDACKIIIGLFLMSSFLIFVKIQEESYNKAKKISDKNQGDLKMNIYEVFEIEKDATQQQIRKQYNKLLIQYHPDKNPECGQTCTDKFQKISEAYDILKDVQKRADFDQNQGVINKIKSQAIQITENNFDKLIKEGNDLWIIQVYEDGDDFCEHIADKWESVVKDFKGSVKFGRILNNDPVVYRLPYKIQIYPTIFSWNGQDIYDLYTYNQNFYKSLSRFILNNIENKVEKLDSNQLKSIQTLNDKPKILIFSQNIDNDYAVTYQSFKYQNILSIYSNQANTVNQAKADANLRQYDAAIYINDNIFKLKKNELGQIKIDQLINFVKSQFIFDLYQENFSDLCLGENRQINFMIIKGTSLENNLLTKAKETIEYYKNDAHKNLDAGSSLFQSYDLIQFLKIDLNHHFKFQKLIKKALKDQKFEDLIMIATQKQKIQFFFKDDIAKFEDTIDSYIHDEQEYLDLDDFMDRDLFYYFQKESYGLFKQLIIDFLYQAFAFKLIVLQILIYFGYFQFINPYNFKHVVIKNQAIFHVCFSFFMAFYINLNDFIEYLV